MTNQTYKTYRLKCKLSGSTCTWDDNSNVSEVGDCITETGYNWDGGKNGFYYCNVSGDDTNCTFTTKDSNKKLNTCFAICNDGSKNQITINNNTIVCNNGGDSNKNIKYVECLIQDYTPVVVVPPNCSVYRLKAIYENVQAHKTLWLTNGRRHFDSFFYNPEQYVNRVRSFIDDVLHRKAAKDTISLIIEDDEEIKNILNVKLAIDGEGKE